MGRCDLKRSGSHNVYAGVLVTVVCTVLPVPGLSAEPTIEIDAGFTSVRLGNQIELALDAHNRSTVEEILAIGSSPLNFTTNNKETPNFGFTKATSWGRFVLLNKSATKRRLVIEADYPLLDDIRFFERGIAGGPLGNWRERAAGDNVPFGKRELDYVNVTFELELEPGEYRHCYIRVQTSSSHQWSMVLWDHGSFQNELIFSQFFHGLLYGSIIIMLFYHLFLFFAFRDRNYLNYVLFMALVVFFLASLSGHVFQYVFPNSPKLVNRSIPFLMAGWMIAAIVFVRRFLGSKEKLPRFDMIFRVFLLIDIVIVIVSPFGLTQPLSRLASALCIFVALVSASASFAAWRSGHMAARYLTLSLVIATTGVVLFALKSLGLAPSNMLTKYGVDVGTLAGSVLFAMALGDRLSTIRREREEARIRQIQEEVRKTTNIEQIKSLSSGVLDVSKTLTEVISDFIDTTADVAQAVMETQLTVGEIELGAQDVESKVSQIAEASVLAASETVRGEAAIRQTTEMITEIRKDSHEILTMSQDLFSRLEEVDSIINSVKAIADQSKILAVNASIEAAKSGKYGRGFSVIAKEVKNLAQESKEATSRITDLLMMARQATEEIVRKSDRGRGNTEKGVTMVAHSGAVVRDMSRAMTDHADTAHVILSTIKNQNQSLGNILRAVDQITTVATRNSDMSERMQSGVTDLDTTMNQLVLMLNAWKTEGDANP